MNELKEGLKGKLSYEEVKKIKKNKEKKAKLIESTPSRDEVISGAIVNMIEHADEVRPSKKTRPEELVNVIVNSLTPDECRRMALIESKKIMSKRNTEIENNIFKDGENPVDEIRSLVASGMSMRRYSKKQFIYFSADEVQRLVDDYFTFCSDQKMNVSVPGLATYLGISTKQLMKIANYEIATEYGDILAYAITAIQTYQEDLAERGIIPSGVHKLYAVNYFGMNEHGGSIDNYGSSADLSKQRKIIEMLPEDD